MGRPGELYHTQDRHRGDAKHHFSWFGNPYYIGRLTEIVGQDEEIGKLRYTIAIKVAV